MAQRMATVNLLSRFRTEIEPALSCKGLSTGWFSLIRPAIES